MIFDVFISCPRALEYLLEDEVTSLGLSVDKVTPMGVYAQAQLAEIYKVCLTSRIASRVQVILLEGQANDQAQIYDLCNKFPWHKHFTSNNTFAIEFHGKSQQIRNSMFGALVIKDAIVDHFNALNATRPSISKENPDILLHAFLKKDKLTVSLDMSGYSLHQRGYRAQNYKAPLKENIAAAMLYRAKWPELCMQGYELYDPFCGTGTIAIEAALIALNIVPGLLRDDQALQNWKMHAADTWQKVRADAEKAIRALPESVKIRASDIHPQAIEIATESIKNAGVAEYISLKQLNFADYQQENTKPGLFITNPPYGERLSDQERLKPLYKKLGENLHTYFQNWHAAIITFDSILAKSIGLKAHKQYSLYNGALACKLYCIHVDADNQLKEFDTAYKKSAAAEMFANRLQKNFQHLKKWATRSNISCYRVYDADLPEYSFAIDIYNDYAVIQEYKAPESVPEKKVKQRQEDAINITPEILNIPPQNVIEKVRERQKGKQQYDKISSSKIYLDVQEGRAHFKVNLTDYLDTGLFLDHRPLRLEFAKLPKESRFLNLYCYTATASVHAALNGAITTNVDLSNTYLNWAEENFRANSLNTRQHAFIQADCFKWLANCNDKFDVIFLDPPSFSNSKSMENTLDIQRDHAELIDASMALLAKNGTLYFSTNFRKFKLEGSLKDKYSIKDISAKTIDQDFKRNTKIHHCFVLQHQDI